MCILLLFLSLVAQTEIVLIVHSQEYEEMLEQQKMLYDSKLEQLDQLHQQKQVSLVRSRSVLCQNLHVHA